MRVRKAVQKWGIRMETSKLQEQYYADMDDKDGSDLKLYLMGREQILPGVSCDRVLRQHYLLHFIMRGRGIFRQGGRHYPVEAGQAFLITPDTFCSYVADEEDPYAYAWVEFDGLSAKDYLDRAGISRSSPIYTGIDISSSSPFCWALWSRLSTAVFSPEKDISRGWPSTWERGKGYRLSSPPWASRSMGPPPG